MSKSVLAIKNCFVQAVIWNGRKVTAEKLFHNVLFLLKQKSSFNPINVFYYAILKLRPVIGLKTIKDNHKPVKFPFPIKEKKRRLLAIKFLLLASKDKRGNINFLKISDLIHEIYVGKYNLALQKKYKLYSEIKENRMFIKKNFTIK